MLNTGEKEKNHPADSFLIQQAFPTVFCQGCGIGTVMHAFIEAVREEGLKNRKVRVVSGTGCTGKVPEFFGFPNQAQTDGRVLRNVLSWQKKDEGLKVLALMNNADFFLSGAEDFIKAARKGANVIVVHINNFICAVSEKGFAPMTPFVRRSFDGKFELPFNMPHLARTAGALYIARWTPLRAGWLKYSFLDAFSKEGFSFIEVVSPCLVYHVSEGRIQDAVDRMKFYDAFSEIRTGGKMEHLDLRRNDKIVIGVFHNVTR